MSSLSAKTHNLFNFIFFFSIFPSIHIIFLNATKEIFTPLTLITNCYYYEGCCDKTAAALELQHYHRHFHHSAAAAAVFVMFFSSISFYIIF